MKIESAKKKAATKECEIVQKEVLVKAITIVCKLGITIFSLHEFVNKIKGRYCS